MAGLAAVVGHITSPYLKGQSGGKGVATTLGAILGVQPLLAIPVLLAFGLGVLILGIASDSVPSWRRWCWPSAATSDGARNDEADMWFAIALAVIVLVRHQRNLRDAWARLRPSS